MYKIYILYTYAPHRAQFIGVAFDNCNLASNDNYLLSLINDGTASATKHRKAVNPSPHL